MKELIGKVISKDMKQTIVVEVFRQKTHALYKKFIRRSKRFKVHSEDQNVNVGDTVAIVSCRPISKEKHFKLLKSLR